MRFLTWNLNHRTFKKPVPQEVPQALCSLAPDLVVLTEYVPGPDHERLLADFKGLGLPYWLLSDHTPKQNQLLFVSRSPVELASLRVPAIDIALPSNVVHARLGSGDFEVFGLRIPDYSKVPKVKRQVWNWLFKEAVRRGELPGIFLGDFNTDPKYPKARCGQMIGEMERVRWRRAVPETEGSYWTPTGKAVSIDHAFLSGHWVIRKTEYLTETGPHCFVGKESKGLSDHAVLLVEADLAKSLSLSEDPLVRRSRRVLRMVQELHKRGYHNLRVSPSMSPSGCHWRCEILASRYTSSTSGAMRGRYGCASANYSSGDMNRYFGWQDSEQDSAVQLAEKFIDRFPEIACDAQGEDSPYVEWYNQMIEALGPDDLPYAYADYDLPVPQGWLAVLQTRRTGDPKKIGISPAPLAKAFG